MVRMGAQPAQHMQCMEVWGGSQLTARSVELGGLDTWVYSKPFGQSEFGGDVYYASSCATGRISRLLLADVSGHGHSVAATAAELRTLMRQFVNRLDQTEFVRLLNQQFTALSRHGAFATAIVTTFFAPSRRLTVCNAGHPRPLLYRSAQRQWDLLGHHENGRGSRAFQPAAGDPGPVRIRAVRRGARSWRLPAELHRRADRIPRPADGEMLGEEGLLRIMRLLPDMWRRKT